MTINFRCGLLVFILIVAGLGIWWNVAAQVPGPGPDLPAHIGIPPTAPARQTNLENPEISFIDSPTPSCVMPKPGLDTCYIQWYHMQVFGASAPYVISMTVAIDGRIRANHAGFFQDTMYVPSAMYGQGFKVACGPPGAAGMPEYGHSYPYILRARDSNNLRSANYGTVYCPADIVPAAGVNLSGPSTGRIGTSYPFTAAVSPITATLPISYSWQVTGQAPAALTSGLSDTQTYSWDTPGIKSIEVTASNARGSYTAIGTITIEMYKAYLPLTRKR